MLVGEAGVMHIEASVVPCYHDAFSFCFLDVQAFVVRHTNAHTHTLILKGLECIADRVRVRFEAQLYVDQWVASSKYLRGELGEINADLLEWPLSHASVSERR